ncbi:restriction endonuclease subunit S [Halomonas sp. BLK-85]
MSYPAYPEYKDSGVEWLGEVPAHWDVTTGKRLFSNRKERALQDDKQLSATQKYGVVPQNLFMESEQQKVTLALSGISSFRHVEVGDFVISLRSFQGGIEISDHSGCVSPAYTVMKPANKVDGSYFKHLLKSYGFISILNVVSDGIRDGKTISYDQFSSVAFPVPPKEEQLLVATFLDHETARIDALVEEQQRLIALLKEKRQAVISHAVTKGLDPEVPMKDSGVEWLGEVPAHWTVGKVKHLAVISGGYAFNSNEFSDSGIQLIRIGNLYQSKLQLDREPIYVPMASRGKYKPFEVKWGDLLMSLTGTLGKRDYGFAVMYDSEEPGLLNQRVAKITPLSEKVDPEFLLLLLQSESYLNQIYSLPSGTKQANLSNSDVLSPWVACPSCLQEQSEIVNRVSELMSRLDQLINIAGVAISLLQERRTSLISAAVTGKIDVRGWQPPEGADAKEASQQEAV